MDPNSYSDVGKTAPSAFYGALSGSVCFPMPLMYNPMNSYPFMSTPFLPMHHPMLSQHGMQDSNILGSDLVGSGTDNLSSKPDDLGSRALAFLQSRYQNMSKCYLPPGTNRRPTLPKYCPGSNGMLDPNTPLYTKEKSDLLCLGFGPDIERCGSAGMTLLSEKESYLSSPTTEIEEPDSSGKCTADVEEQKVIPRWNCDPSQPPLCPICTRTIPLAELGDHYITELERLNDLARKKEWTSNENNQQEQANRIDQIRLLPYHSVEKRCPEFRKETYLRVRANRMNRLGVNNARLKKQNLDESERPWKMQRLRSVCSPKRENSEDSAQSVEKSSTSMPGEHSMLMLELTVQQLAGRDESKPDLEQNQCIRPTPNSSVYQGPVLPIGESYQDIPKQGDCPPLVDSSSNNFNAPDFGLYQSSKCGADVTSRCDVNSNGDSCTTTDVKCFVCMERYRNPVVSVCCWHVHCEACWLKTLGSKRLCPQCETITSPEDLRRIHL